MKNEKGFTLTELLAVLVILIIFMLMAFPNFINLSNNAKIKYDRTTEVLIKTAAKMYVTNNPDEIKKNMPGPYCIPLGKLIAYEYLDSDIKNSKSQVIPDERCVNITYENNKYKYELGSNDISTGIDYFPPVITIENKTTSNYENYVECSNNMDVSNIEMFEENCKVGVTDVTVNSNGNKIKMGYDGSIYFENIKVPENNRIVNEIKLNKTVAKDGNRIHISYNAEDSAGNKAIPFQVSLTLPE